MELIYTNNKPTPNEFWSLFATTGWNDEYKLTKEELYGVVQNSCYCCCVYNKEVLVGFGRIVSDKFAHAMIYDMIVLPEYQGKGIGSAILKKLLDWCDDKNIRDVQLFSAKGKKEFYEKHGFTVRPDDAPGMQLKRD